MRRLILTAAILLGFAISGHSQQVQVPADCILRFNFTAAGTTSAFQNSGSGCTTWTLTYQANGFTVVSLEFDMASDIGSAPGTFSRWATLSNGGTLPLTGTTFGTITGTGYAPWLQVKLNNVTGTGTISGVLSGWRNSVSVSATSVTTPVTSTPNVTYSTPLVIPITALTSTVGTVATATTVLAGTIYCSNKTAAAHTLNITNAAGNSVICGFSIPANSAASFNFGSGILMTGGVKWWADTRERNQLFVDGVAVMRKVLLAFGLFILSVAPLEATTRYVSSGVGAGAPAAGSDGNTCMQSQTITTPKLTLTGVAGAFSCMAANDILLVRGGTYNENIDATITTLHSGTTFPGTTTQVNSYMAEVVTLTGYVYMTGINNFIFSGINVNGTGISPQGGGLVEVNGGTGIRFTAAEIQNCPFECILTAVNNGVWGTLEFTSLKVHNSGQVTQSPPAHGIYLSGGAQGSALGPTLINNVESYNNTASDNLPGGQASTSFGFTEYDSGTGIIGNTTVSNSNFHNNGSGASIGVGANDLFFNNLSWGNVSGIGANGDGLEIGYGPAATNVRVFNNAFYNNAGSAILVTPFGHASGTVIRNNAMFLNGSTITIDQGTTITQSNNLTTDPKWVNPPVDFHIQTTSAAKLAGANLTSLTITALDTDLYGTGRPSSGACPGVGCWDIGVAQFVQTLLPSTTILVSSLNPSTQFTSVTFTATVTGSGATPTGTINFNDGSTTLNTATLSSGSITYALSTLAPGNHVMTGVYLGDATYQGSTSNVINQFVNAATPNSCP